MATAVGENSPPEHGAQTDSNASFLRASRAGNLDKVLDYLATGTDINTANQNGLNALHLASKEGHVTVVVELLARGALIDTVTKKGNTALHIASLAGQAAVVSVLLQNGSNVNAQSQNGFTPLYMAAQENHMEVVKILLDHGGNQGIATEDGFTPLAVALQQGHDQVVAILLENDTKGRVRLPALHIAARKDDTKAAALLLQGDHNADVQSKSGFTPLHISAHYGNVNVATLLLNRGAAVNFAANNGITALHVAAKRGNGAVVQLLVQHGAHIDGKTRDGLTPLHCAARSGHERVVEALLEQGAPILAKTKNGLSPLHMATQGDHVECVQVLLHFQAPVDDVTLDYLTALHVAAHCGHYSTAKLLLDKSANPNVRALNGFTPLHIACKKNRIRVVELLLKYGASIQTVTESGLTPMHVSAFMGNLNIALLLLQNSASPNISNVRGETPLHMAARAGQMEVVRSLLRNGAEVDAKAREDQTALHISARLGNVEIVQLLLQHMAFPDSATTGGLTPLHVATREGHQHVAEVLLEHGASLSAATKKGFTPLHVAAKYDRLDITTLLLQRFASLDAAGKNGLTPLHVASHYDNQEVALLLLDQGASPHATAKNGYTPLHIAAKKGQLAIVRALLEYGANSKGQTQQGVVPLHLAAQQGHADVCALLLRNDAEANSLTKSGLSSLHLAAQEDHVGVAQVLVDHEADVDAATKLGYTPLIVACHYGNSRMVNFLLQHGAEVNAKTKSGYSPLHQAAQQGHTHIINLLLRNGAQPDLVTEHGNTALAIARRLGYISVVDTLKVVTLETVTTTTTMVVTTKHKINVPETMTEILEVSDDEGEDALEGDSGAYLRAEDLRELGDDSLPSSQFLDGGAAYGTGIWPTRSGSLRSFLSERSCSLARGPSSQEPTLIEEFAHIVAAPFYQHLAVPKEEEKEEEVSESRTRVSYSSELMDNVAMPSSTIHSGFLVSFMVDARGGSMRGCRHHGLRIVIPPRQCPAPTRITCRLVKRHRLATLPPLVEAEGQASRVLEVGPAGGQFLGPVIVEIPHFASLRHVERELIVLRSETGETWREHQYEATQEELNQILNGMDEELDSPEQLARKHICRVVTRDFPQFFAVVSRIRQESHPFGPEGGLLSSQTVPQVQAVFPEGALTKRIRVGLQVQPVPEDLVCKILGNKASFSPIITLEPRRRKFHKPITMTLPLPETSLQDLLTGRGGTSPTLRLLCSITGGTGPAQWEDISGNTPLAFNEKCVSFTTNVSARFWLIDCRQVQEAVEFASQLYRELVCVPYLAKFVVFAKTHDPVEARLRCFCMTDDKVDKTLEHQENFTEVARSRDVEVLEGKAIYVECLGNLVPLMKAGQQHVFTFFAFKENRLPFFVKIRDSNQEKCGRLCFMKDPKSVRGLTPQAVCNLNVTLPPYRKTGSTGDKTFVSLPVRRRHGTSDDTGVGLSPPGTDKVEIRLSQLAQLLGPSWTDLARELSIGPDIVKQIEEENPNSPAEQAFCLLSQWVEFAGADGTDRLGAALTRINRLDLAELLEQQSQALHEDSLGWPTELDQTLALDHTHGLSSPTADHLPLFSPKPMTLSPTRHSFEDHSTCCPAALPDPVSPYQTLSRLHDAGRPASPSCADDPDHMDTNNLNGLEFADVDKLEQHELNDKNLHELNEKNSPEAVQETEGAIPYMERPIISLGFQSNELFAHSTPSSTTSIPRREETEQPTLSSYSSLLVNVGSEGATTYITEDNEKSSISERYKETVEALMSPDEPLLGSWLEPIPEPESTFQEPLKNCQNSKPKLPEQDEGSNLLDISGEKEPGGGWCAEKPGFKEDPGDGLQYVFVLPSSEVEMGVPAEVSKTEGATPTEQSIESTTQESFTDSFGNIITCKTKISMNVQSEEAIQNPLDHHDLLTTTTLEPATSPTLSPTTSSKMISKDSLGSN